MKNYFIALFLVVFMFFGFIESVNASVGASPNLQRYDLLLPNTEVRNTVTFTRIDAEDEETFKVEAIGEAADAVVFVGGDTITFPPTIRKVKYEYGLRPGRIPTGEYEAKLQVNEIITTGEGVQATATGASVRIQFRIVNEEVVECVVQSARVEGTEVGQPLNLKYLLRNEGNVNVKPSVVKITFTDVNDANFILEEEVDIELLPFSLPFSNDVQDFELRSRLQPGEYNVDVVMGGSCGEFQGENPLEIFDQGRFDQTGDFISYDTDKEEYVENELVTIQGVFKNTSRVDYKGNLISSISREGNKIDIIEGEPLLIRAGEEVLFEDIYRPSEFGEYEAEGYVVFGVNESERKQAPFAVVETNTFVLALLLSLLTLLLGFIIFLFYRRKPKEEEKYPIGAYCEYDPSNSDHDRAENVDSKPNT